MLVLLTDYFAYQELLDFLKVTSEQKNVHLWIHFLVFFFLFQIRTFEGTLRRSEIYHRPSENIPRLMRNAPCFLTELLFLDWSEFSIKKVGLSLNGCLAF